MRGQYRQGFSLLFVLFVGVLLLALAGSLLVLSNSQSERSVSGRERLLAETSAENGVNYLVATFRENLLSFGQDGNAPPVDAEDPYLFTLNDQFYFGSTLSDGQNLVLDDYLDDRPLATNFNQVVTRTRAQLSDQRWWLYSLGAIQWRPIDLTELIEKQGLIRIADREVTVVGESAVQRQVRARNLGFYLDFNDPLVSLKPAAALALVPVLGYDSTLNKQPLLTITGSISTISLLQFQGPLLLDTQAVDNPPARMRGQTQLNFLPTTEEVQINRTLYPSITNPKAGFWQLGDGTPDIEGQTKLSSQPVSISADRRATLQLDIPFAQALGRLGTSYDGEFKVDQDITAEGGLIYDAKKAHFDFSKLRNGILWITSKPLILKPNENPPPPPAPRPGQPAPPPTPPPGFQTITYSGQGTIIITAPGPQGLEIQNVSLVPDPDSPEASLSIIAAPQPQANTTPLPPGTIPNVPPSVNLTFQSPLVPQTILADSQDRVVTFDCSKNSRLASVDPLITNDTYVRRTNGFMQIGQLSIPQFSRAYALGNTCVILARTERDQTEVILSLGFNTPQTTGRIQPQALFNAKAVPLQRIQADIYSMNPVLIRSSNRIIGRLVAPRLRILAGGANPLLYGVDQKDRYQVDFLYRSLPTTVGSWLMTLRSNLTPRPVPLPITYLEPRQWRTLPASALTTTGEALTLKPLPRITLPPLTLATSPPKPKAPEPAQLPLQPEDEEDPLVAPPPLPQPPPQTDDTEVP